MNRSLTLPRRLTRSITVAPPRAAVVALILISAGCTTAPGGSPPVVAQCSAPRDGGVRSGPALVGQTYGMQMMPLPLNSVQFGSAEASGSLAIQSIFAARTSTDMVFVTARLVSCLDAPAVVRMRTSFLRTDTAPSETPSAWKSVYLEPRATAVYTELSTTRDAASYLIEIAK